MADQIFSIIKDYFNFGISGKLILIIIGIIFYSYLKTKLLEKNHILAKKDKRLLIVFTGYIIILIGTTLLNRTYFGRWGINFHLFSVYRGAWNSASLRIWIDIIFSIIIFIPLGILLPITNKRFHKIQGTMGIALGSTLLIQTLQIIIGKGIFGLDNIFNNLLGALIGYGIIMAIFTVCNIGKNETKKVVSYILPLILVVSVFTGMFLYYNSKEFGNMALGYTHKTNMKDVKITLNQELNDKKIEVPIYKAPSYNKETGKEFAIDFFENLGIDASHMIVEKGSSYYLGGDPEYVLRIDYQDGRYDYKEFSVLDETAQTTEDNLVEKLKNLNIYIPEESVFSETKDGGYKWTVERRVQEENLIEGSLYCGYYSDNTIKEIINEIITYKKIREIPIKSEIEAYNEIKNGSFLDYYGEKIESIDIRGVELDYRLDSKGYYQPIYLFDSLINGERYKIYIPAII